MMQWYSMLVLPVGGDHNSPHLLVADPASDVDNINLEPVTRNTASKSNRKNSLELVVGNPIEWYMIC